jgi:hypothetical protein
MPNQRKDLLSPAPSLIAEMPSPDAEPTFQQRPSLAHAPPSGFLQCFSLRFRGFPHRLLLLFRILVVRPALVPRILACLMRPLLVGGLILRFSKRTTTHNQNDGQCDSGGFFHTVSGIGWYGVRHSLAWQVFPTRSITKHTLTTEALPCAL